MNNPIVYSGYRPATYYIEVFFAWLLVAVILFAGYKISPFSAGAIELPSIKSTTIAVDAETDRSKQAGNPQFQRKTKK